MVSFLNRLIHDVIRSSARQQLYKVIPALRCNICLELLLDVQTIAFGFWGWRVAAFGLKQRGERILKGLQQHALQALLWLALSVAAEPCTLLSVNGDSRLRQREGEVMFANLLDLRPEGWSEVWAVAYTCLSCFIGLVVKHDLLRDAHSVLFLINTYFERSNNLS